MAGWVMHLWNEWSIQILVLLSFTLQVFILLFARMRQRDSRTWRVLLWLAYLLADTTALYTLGHISNSQLPELRPAAFWAQFLLLHLGGQDTMTAYSIEDNQLWLRHLLTLVLQALGAAYMFYRHIADGGTLLVMAAVLIYLVGIMKYGERVWALKTSSHEGITNLLNNVEVDESDQSQESLRTSLQEQLDVQFLHVNIDEAENVLRDAHELLPICMGQFVDYKFRPSVHQLVVTCKYCTLREYLFELIGMQLSLMHDIFYTKAVVIHTWYGCCNRALSSLAMVAAVLLFTFKDGKDGYTSVDVVFTYFLLGGAIVLEMTSVLRAIGSSWTCAFFRDKMRSHGDSFTWNRLHSAVMFPRRLFKPAEFGRKRSWSVGQHNLLDLFTLQQDFKSMIARIAGLENWLNKQRITGTVGISADSQRLMWQDIERIVKTCDGVESQMLSYRGQSMLATWSAYNEDSIGWCIDIDFVDSILAWHFATNLFLSQDQSAAGTSAPPDDKARVLIEEIKIAIKLLSNYMMFLLVEHPYLLPSPVRARQYDLVYSWLLTEARTGPLNTLEILDRIECTEFGSPGVLGRAATLAKLQMYGPGEYMKKLQMILGVWVEMLCYAASHCSRDSHARQLNSGAELITAIWILQTTIYNHINSGTDWFALTRREFYLARRVIKIPSI